MTETSYPSKQRSSTLVLQWSLILFTCTHIGQAQETRAGQIEQARDEKAKHLTPFAKPKSELLVTRIQKRWLDPLFGKSDGLHLRLGNMANGSGFALGPEYRRSDLLDGNLVFRISAAGSTRAWYQGGMELLAPKLANDHAFVNFSVIHRDYASMQYYGSGPNSQKGARSDYRLEDTHVQLRPGIQPFRRVQAGAIGGLLAVNVGPGNRSAFINTEQEFTPAQAPGIDKQTSFWQTGAFLSYDWRNYLSETTRGGFYSGQYVHNSDRDLGAFSFGRFDMEARQFIPFFNEKRVIALHGISSLTTTSGNQRVPFYLQPRLGGPYDLRGFRAFRFYGDNLIATTAEYRWEASTVLEMAAFIDAGKVFNDWSQWNVHDMERSYGFGFRFKSQHTTALRIDTGFSREGFQIWVRFNNVF
ncbi:MAG TPA: BamA/TamA family outer membrane protein [Bryobacteraceae bacterium]|nr:BamA/TamA family outer membrane protein [Bryobacteraceae bacterium]